MKRLLIGLITILLIAAAGFGIYLKVSDKNTVTNANAKAVETKIEEDIGKETAAATAQETEDTEVVEERVVELPAKAYSVSSSNDIATKTGMDVLAAGGNAVDAAVAMAYVLSVVEPYSNGLGGSGGMLIYDSYTGECKLYDYRSCAGSSETLKDQVGVPGMVAGMEKINEDYGTVSMSTLIEPARYYAENGITVYKQLSDRFQENVGTFNGCYNFYNNSGDLLYEGETLYQTELAETLQYIQDNGAEGFYNGRIADDIAASCSISKEDLVNYQVYVEDALYTDYLGNRVYSSNGPFSGQVLLQMFDMADSIDICDGENNPMQYLSELKTISNAALKDRYSTICDPLYYSIDQMELLTPEHIEYLLYGNQDEAIYEYESVETTSFTVVDSNGLCVSCTNTLSSFFGSHYMVDGIIMNNSNSNFSQSGVNAYEPGKRSRTYTTPTIIVKQDGTMIAIGTPGGNNIPCILFQVITDILKNGNTYQDAVDKTRVVYRKGVLIVEGDNGISEWLDLSAVNEQIVWIAKGYAWGSVTIAGYSPEEGAFSAFDYRRGATMSGTFNS